MSRGLETEKAHEVRVSSGFYKAYMSGQGLDVGYDGGVKDSVPVLETAIGVDLNYPNYDGTRLPFDNESKDYIYSSHCLEHIVNPTEVIQDWFRVIKVGGYLVIVVPHQFLYEKKLRPPSMYNRDHKMFLTPAKLLFLVENSLEPNSYRIVHMRDNDMGYNYNLPPTNHSQGCYEIECVIKKINKPNWELI